MRKTRKKSKAVLAVYLFGLCEVAWFLWSWADVLAHQHCGGTQNALNLFRMMIH